MDSKFNVTSDVDTIFSAHFKAFFGKYLKLIHKNHLEENCAVHLGYSEIKSRFEIYIDIFSNQRPSEETGTVEDFKAYVNKLEDAMFHLFIPLQKKFECKSACLPDDESYENMTEMLLLTLLCTIYSMLYYFNDLTSLSPPFDAHSSNLDVLLQLKNILPNVLSIDENVQRMLNEHPVTFLTHISFNMCSKLPIKELSKLTINLIDSHSLTPAGTVVQSNTQKGQLHKRPYLQTEEEQARNRKYFQPDPPKPSTSSDCYAGSSSATDISLDWSKQLLLKQLKIVLGLNIDARKYQPDTEPVSNSEDSEEVFIAKPKPFAFCVSSDSDEP